MHEEEVSIVKGKLSGEVAKIKESFKQLMNNDVSLKEGIGTFFREQGLTIASILTAIGMTISLIVLAVKGGGGSGGNTGGKSKGGAGE